MSVLRNPAGLVAYGAHILKLNQAMRTVNRKRLLVLNYHSIVPNEYAADPIFNSNVISISEFSRQMTYVAQFFRPIQASELRNWRSETERAVLVTFDDGYRNNLTCAAPVLQRLGIPALIAVCPGYVGTNRILWPDEVYWRIVWWPEQSVPAPRSKRRRLVPAELRERLALADDIRQYCKRIPRNETDEYLTELQKHPLRKPIDDVHGFLSWDEILSLRSNGFDVASHTMEHPMLSQLASHELTRELRDSKSIIEQHTGCECSWFVYPNGAATDAPPRVIEEVRRTGYQFAFTVMGRLADPGDEPLLIDRVYIPGGISAAEFESRISGFHNVVKHWFIA